MTAFWIEQQPVAGATVRIGRAAGCELRLRDAMVADEHCRLDHREGRCFVTDLDSPTGTYVNGRQVRAETVLQPGDAIVVGATRITTTAADQGGLRLSVRERSFFFKPAMREAKTGRWVPGDRERWRESEITFGSMPMLWAAVWSAVAVALLAGVSLLLPSGRALLLQPGSLDAAHQDLACSACHDPLSRPPAARCLECHAPLAGHHPLPVQAGGKAAEGVCLDCHSEHHGSRRTLRMQSVATRPWQVPVLERDPAFVPAMATLGERCATCHPDQVPEQRAGAVHRPEPVAIEPIPHDAFDHRRHVAKGIACDRCHVPDPDHRGQRERRDFLRVDYRACMGCHGSREDAPAERRTDPAFDPALDAPKFRLATDWHGASAAHCEACHLPDPRVVAGALRPKVQRTRRQPQAYAFTTRSHASEFEQHRNVPADSCTNCHKSSVPKPRANQQPFDHRTHLAGFGAGTAAAASLQTQCLQCHQELRTATTLTGTWRGPTGGHAEQACAGCHGTAPKPVEVAVQEASVVAEVMDFPHASHLRSDHESLQQGCLTCHRFESKGATAVPVTLPGSGDCKNCHDKKHAAIGGGSCRRCHGELDPVYRQRLEAPDWPWRRPRTAFSHFSDGHVQSLAGPCASCHAGVEQATTISMLAPPDESSAVCRDCHLGQRRRFHFPHPK